MMYIYKITNIINQKCYIGSTKDPSKRWMVHKSTPVNNHIRKAFLKYEIENFTFEIIEETEEALLLLREAFWIVHFNSCNSNLGYNKNPNPTLSPFVELWKNDDSFQKLVSAKMKATWENPETRAKRTENSQKRMLDQRKDPVFIAKMEKALVDGVYHNQEIKNRRADGIRKFWETDASNKTRNDRKEQTQARWIAGTIEKARSALKAHTQTEEFRKRKSELAMELNKRPDIIEAKRKRGKAQVGKLHTPEAKAKARHSYHNRSDEAKRITSQKFINRNNDARFQSYAAGCRRINKITTDLEKRKELKMLLKTQLNNLDQREKLVDEGYLIKSEWDGLILFGYTDKTTFDRHWNELTLTSRGTVYEKATGRIVARAFDKFFNLDEHETTRTSALPDEPFIAMEKMDGSLGILFKWKDEWCVCTRGSFYSEQSAQAKLILFEQINMESWPKGWTPLVEIIYPENRIIVNYGDKRKLILLAARNIETGEYMKSHELRTLAGVCGFDSPKLYIENEISHYMTMAKTIDWQKEGYVLRYQSGLMVKIKGEDYLRIAKIKSQLSPLSVWEAMMAGRIDDYLIGMPEEIRPEAEAIHEIISRQVHNLLVRIDDYCNKFDFIIEEVDTSNKDTLKKCAMAITSQTPKWMHGFLFSVMRKHPDGKVLLNLIRPTGNKYIDLQTIDSHLQQEVIV